MDSFKRCSDEKVPDRCEPYRSLKEECISKKDYLHAIDVWNTLKKKTIGDYHDRYLKADVLLLADVFKRFINTCLLYYGLDSCDYFSRPGLRWYVLLKMKDN